MSNGQPEADQVDQMGPIDFFVIEFPHRQTAGEGLPLLVDLVDRGIIRVLDLAFIRKESDGTVRHVAVADLGPEFAVFEGASSGLLGQADFDEAAAAIAPDSAAGLLVYENRWAAPFVAAVRRNGGVPLAFERIPVQDLIDSLDAAEAAA